MFSLMKEATILRDALQRGPCSKRRRGYISSYGCCNRLAQTWWLKTTEMYSLHSGNWKFETSFTGCNQGVSKAVASSGGSRGESFPWHFQPWWLPASLTCGCIIPINTSVVTLLPPLLCLSFVKDTADGFKGPPRESRKISSQKSSSRSSLVVRR